MERQKIVERDTFTYEDKLYIALKSDNRCCRCGKKVFFDGYGATVDHYVPISKGGTNRDINIIMLCDNCNHEKSNRILPPEDYLKYLNEDHLDRLKGYFESYIKSFEYLNRKNLLACDAYMIKVAPNIKGGHFTYKAASKMPYQEYWLKRAGVDDLEKIKAYYREYLKKYDIKDDLLSADKQIEFFSKFGCIYYLEKSGEIKTVFAITVRQMRREAMCGEIDRALQVFVFSRYANTNSRFLAGAVHDKLVYNFAKEQGFECMTSVLSIPKEDPLSFKIAAQYGRSDAYYEEFGHYTSEYIFHGYKKMHPSDEEALVLKEFFQVFTDVNEAAKKWVSQETNKSVEWMLGTLQDKEDFIAQAVLDARDMMSKKGA